MTNSKLSQNSLVDFYKGFEQYAPAIPDFLINLNTVESLYKRRGDRRKCPLYRDVFNMESLFSLAALGRNRRKRRPYRDVAIIERPHRKI